MKIIKPTVPVVCRTCDDRDWCQKMCEKALAVPVVPPVVTPVDLMAKSLPSWVSVNEEGLREVKASPRGRPKIWASRQDRQRDYLRRKKLKETRP